MKTYTDDQRQQIKKILVEEALPVLKELHSNLLQQIEVMRKQNRSEAARMGWIKRHEREKQEARELMERFKATFFGA